MAPFWKRRREARRRRPFFEDPENAARRADCARQMKIFDQLTPEARMRIAQGRDDTDTVDLLRRVEMAGPGDRARRALRARGVLPCDVPIADIVSLELTGD